MQKLLNTAVSELVGKFIAWMAIVALNPMPLDLVLGKKGVKFLPKVHVFHG
jgi:hypothetical protein